MPSGLQISLKLMPSSALLQKICTCPASTTHLPPFRCPSAYCCVEAAPPGTWCPNSPEYSLPLSASPPVAGVAHWWRAHTSQAASARALHNSGGRQLCPCWEWLRRLWTFQSPFPCMQEKRDRGSEKARIPQVTLRHRPNCNSPYKSKVKIITAGWGRRKGLC